MRRLRILGNAFIILQVLASSITIRPVLVSAPGIGQEKKFWQRSGPDTSITLLSPAEGSELSNTTPTFSWLAVPSKEPVEYRLLISDNYGKIVFDQWIGTDTTYALRDNQVLSDLILYFWSVQANVQGQRWQSPIGSFSIDKRIATDLVVKNISMKKSRGGWKAGDQIEVEAEVENSGPQDIGHGFVTLFSGNLNSNYQSYFAYRRTIALDTVRIDSLPINKPQTVLLSAPLPYGFNHLFVKIEPGFGATEIISDNNYQSGLIIQTEKRRVRFQGLFVFYKNYFHPEVGDRKLGPENLQQIYHNICRFQRYFWDHTQILVIDVDTIHVTRKLKKEDFAFQDDQWGFYLPPKQIEQDLRQRFGSQNPYDFIYVYYSWWNSPKHWSGYSGYAFKEYHLGDHQVTLLAQPVQANKIGSEEIAIHEFLHLLQHRFESCREWSFYSPHQRALVTNFESDRDYFDWLLETWPTEKWFKLPTDQIVAGAEWSPNQNATDTCFFPNRLNVFHRQAGPFAPDITISYKIPPSVMLPTPVAIQLTLYDLSGRRIRTLVEGTAVSGMYHTTWDGTDELGRSVANSVYFSVLQAGDKRLVKKLLYLR
ncbi:MAG: hypothetical protein ONB16_06655 [candidate division KSB1 bacterium]|nr:hypothetical protein [candidate division KSB1 bacterium]MDZ7340538.1 hypothetical protein [candidate division KSB1 bacterium]